MAGAATGLPILASTRSLGSGPVRQATATDTAMAPADGTGPALCGDVGSTTIGAIPKLRSDEASADRALPATSAAGAGRAPDFQDRAGHPSPESGKLPIQRPSLALSCGGQPRPRP